MPKVSLYIPCFNAEKTIQECLENVMRQTFPIDEILIIDDGCQDQTADIVSHYPVKLIRHPKNKGLAASRNTAFKQARNDFVAALDADCLPHSDWLKELMLCLEDEAVAGSGGTLTEKYSEDVADKWRAMHMSQTWGREVVNNPPFLYGSNSVFRKKVLEEIGLYNEKYRSNREDVDLSSRIYDYGLNLVYNPKARVEHIRKDTVKSVLSAYRSWFYYTHMNTKYMDRVSRRFAVNLGRLAEYPEISEVFLREDAREGNQDLLFLDLLLVFYCTWLDLKQLFRILLLSEAGI
ncbi:MAG: glycosyltransferase [Candidatus Omnitrophica bacterium]|nr:glycosyltransferase [Candidatus Omnitrophota bacterium]